MLLASPLAAQEVDPATATANAALEAAPVFDGHNDVPNQLRARVANQINGFDFADTTGTGESHPQGAVMQTDLARLKEGKVGAQYWSVYVPSNPDEPEAVQEVIEQIDVTKRLIARYPEGLRYAETADQVERAMAEGKVASLLGMEGGHSIGSSLAVLRQLYALGARYMTLTHNSNTPWADAATDTPVHGGLSAFGDGRGARNEPHRDAGRSQPCQRGDDDGCARRGQGAGDLQPFGRACDQWPSAQCARQRAGTAG